jgi:hypothetical protein
MVILLSIFILVFGLIMIIVPELSWEISEMWKSNDASEPSDAYKTVTRIKGIVFTVIGAGGLISSFFL